MATHPLVELARRAIESHVNQGLGIVAPSDLPPDLPRRAAAFVSIHRNGKLRGCIGTLEPVCDSLAEEVIRSAISAATQDPRFLPIEAGELQELEIKVDVLSAPELVSGPKELDPKRYGLIVQSREHRFKRGVLLPDLPGIDTVQQQIHWTRHHKAHITDPDEPVEMYRFEVKRLR